jgi:hypothetical protein
MINMARPIDYVFQGKLINYMKTEYMKNGGKPFYKTVKQIANDLFKDATDTQFNQVWRYLKGLEKRGDIRVITRGHGSQASEYEFIETNNLHQQQSSITKETFEQAMHDYAQQQNEITQNNLNTFTELYKQMQSLQGELILYKQAMSNLNLYGINGPDAEEIFIAKKGSNIKSLIEQAETDLLALSSIEK